MIRKFWNKFSRCSQISRQAILSIPNALLPCWPLAPGDVVWTLTVHPWLQPPPTPTRLLLQDDRARGLSPGELAKSILMLSKLYCPVQSCRVCRGACQVGPVKVGEHSEQCPLPAGGLLLLYLQTPLHAPQVLHACMANRRHLGVVTSADSERKKVFSGQVSCTKKPCFIQECRVGTVCVCGGGWKPWWVLMLTYLHLLCAANSCTCSVAILF